MPDWDLLLTDARIATMRRGAVDYGAIDAGSIAIAGGLIDWIGAIAELPVTLVPWGVWIAAKAGIAAIFS